MSIEVNDYISFERSIKTEWKVAKYGPRGAGVVNKVNKGKKTVKDELGRVIGRHRVARVDTGPLMGICTAIIDEGTFTVTGQQTKLVDVKPVTAKATGKDWSHL